MDPQEAYKVAEEEVRRCTDFQRSIHYIPPEKLKSPAEDPNQPPDIEDYYVAPPPIPLSWNSSPVLVQFKGFWAHDGANFDIDKHFDIVSSFEVQMFLPRVEILPPYRGRCRIAWSPNVATNLLGAGRVSYGNQIAENLSVYLADSLRNFNAQKVGEQEARLRETGTIASLTDWAEAQLPHFGPLLVNPHFHFTEPENALRPSMLGSDGVTISFKPRPYTEVLRMQEKVVSETGEETWECVPFVKDRVKIETCRKDSADYQEMAYKATGDGVIYPSYMRERAVHCTSSLPLYIKHGQVKEKTNVGFGEAVDVPLEDCKATCAAYVILAFNQRAPALGCFSNYTTNPEDPWGGSDPIDSCEIFHGDSRAGVYGAQMMSSGQAKKCSSYPFETGYHIICLSPSDPFSPARGAFRGRVPNEDRTTLKVHLVKYQRRFAGALPGDKFTVIVILILGRVVEYQRVEDKIKPFYTVKIAE